MITKELIKTYFLTKGRTTKYFLLGKEDNLFLIDKEDDPENLFNSISKSSRRFFYRINYLIALIFGIPFIISGLKTIIADPLFLLSLLIFLPIFLKPLVHFFALENKRNKKNIFLYKELYPDNKFEQITEISGLQEIQNRKDNLAKDEKGIPKAVIAILASLFVLGILIYPIKQLIEGESIDDNSYNQNLTSSETKTENLKSTEKLNKSKIINSNDIKEVEEIKSKEEVSNTLQSNTKVSEVKKNSISLIDSVDTSTNKLVDKNQNYATIIGTDIIIRDGHSTKSKIVGSFKEAGEKVVVIGTFTSEERTVLIKNKIIVNDREGDDNILPKGKSVKILAINEEPPVEILISFKTKEGETKEGMVPENALDYINESWYKVKRDNGVTGWVFGKFIKLD